MSSTRRVWIVEEVETPAGVAQRQTQGEYILNEDGGWRWIMPMDMTPEATEKWKRVMKRLSDVDGEDLRPVVCYAGLVDYCSEPKIIERYE